MFNSVKLQGHAFYDGKSMTDTCSSSSEESPKESLFDRLWNKTTVKITEQLNDNDFCTVTNRFKASALGTRCIKATHVGGDTNEVHANHVKLGKSIPAVICSQAPTREIEGEFWKVVVAHSHFIVDLTTQIEKNDKSKAIHSYYPECGNVHFAGEGRIDLNPDPRTPGLFSYTVHLPHQEPQEVERLHFDSWVDFKAVSVEQFDALLVQLENKRAEHPDQPLWIHCRAGVGRTGTVVVGLALRQLHREGRLTKENSLKMLNKLILKGRRQRDVYFVQSKDQYKLLLQYKDFLLK